jgi:hypothetical protein
MDTAEWISYLTGEKVRQEERAQVTVGCDHLCPDSANFLKPESGPVAKPQIPRRTLGHHEGFSTQTFLSSALTSLGDYP